MTTIDINIRAEYRAECRCGWWATAGDEASIEVAAETHGDEDHDGADVKLVRTHKDWIVTA